MKIKLFYRDGDKHIIEFVDGRKVEVGLNQLKRTDRNLLELIDDLVNPIDIELKIRLRNKLIAMHDDIKEIKTHLGI